MAYENRKIVTYHVSDPLKEPFKNSIFTLPAIEHVLVEIHAEGLVGYGGAIAYQYVHGEAMHTCAKAYAERLIGKDTDLIQKQWKDTCAIMNATGVTGLPVIAWAPFDTALWDLMGKAAQLPVYKMLGAWKTVIPVYASGGALGPVEKLIKEAVGYKEQGFTKYKMKLGSLNWKDDINRVKAVQDACGKDFEVMVDVNQGWDVKKSIRVAPILLDMGVTYFEEPVHAQDYAGQAEIRSHVDVDVVAGESLFTTLDFVKLLKGNCVDMINPDLGRCGGVTEFIQVAALAKAFNKPLTAHVYTDVSAHLIAAAPTGTMLEVVPEWWSGIYDNGVEIVNGMTSPREDPGFGITINYDTVKKYLNASYTFG